MNWDNMNDEKTRNDNCRNRRAVTELLMIYFSRMDKSIDDFSDNGVIFTEVIKTEAKVL